VSLTGKIDDHGYTLAVVAADQPTPTNPGIDLPWRMDLRIIKTLSILSATK